jgi:hypothetical protein
MECPFCNKEMENGFVQSGKEIFWGDKKHKVFCFPHDEGEFSLADGWNSAVINACCCRDCKKIIIDYSNINF